MDKIEIPFGAHDSELKGWEYTIPKGFTAEIKDGKIIVKETESEDERIRKDLVGFIEFIHRIACEGRREMAINECDIAMCERFLTYLEKQKEIPMPDSTELIEMWDKEKAMLEEKDFRGDEWRLAYNAFMDGFARGTCVKFDNPKEQKPVEWSEEDEKKLEDLTSLLAILEGCSTVNVGTAAKYNGWLNSLRSRPKSSDNWKPSEEHVKALWKLMKYAVNLSSYCDIQKEIESLYEQLKKLEGGVASMREVDE